MKNVLIFNLILAAFIARPLNGKVNGLSLNAQINAETENVALITNSEEIAEVTNNEVVTDDELVIDEWGKNIDSIYLTQKIQNTGLNQQAFKTALKGFKKLKQAGKVTGYKLAICDFTQPSNQKRLYILDTRYYKILFRTWVAHGKNSGDAMANSFSNVADSHKSSLGFYTTGGTYQGENGYSLYLHGMDNGLNDNAYSRSIVMHGAGYVSADAANGGSIGRSFGCPSVSNEVHKKTIDLIKNGNCLVVFANQSHFTKRSFWLK
jgi:hypothetical protein